MENHINDKLCKLPIHQLLKQTSLSDFLWGFDGVSLYSSMWDEKSIYPRKETGYAYTKVTNNDLINKFNNPTFTRGGAYF